MIKTTGMMTIMDNPFEEINDKLSEVLRTLGDMYQHNVPPTHELTSMSDVENGEVTLTFSLRKDLKEKLEELASDDRLDNLLIEAVEQFVDSKSAVVFTMTEGEEHVFHSDGEMERPVEPYVFPEPTKSYVAPAYVDNNKDSIRLRKMYNALITSMGITNEFVAFSIGVPSSTLCNWKVGKGGLSKVRLENFERFVKSKFSNFYDNYNSFCEIYNIDQNGGKQ